MIKDTLNKWKEKLSRKQRQKQVPGPGKGKVGGLLGNLFRNLREKRRQQQKPELERIKLQVRKKHEHQIRSQERKKRVKEYLGRAGVPLEPLDVSKKLFKASVFVTLAISGYLVYYFSTTFGITWGKVALWIGTLWIGGFVGILFILWVLLYIVIDLRIFKRRLEIEEILPDFLQLTSANIKAGMTVDRALWYAVRPNFGVLAKEIESVAKETMGGEDLTSALRKFAEKYDSQVLQRSVSLIIEGIESGGEIGDLLIKVADNIEDQKIMKKEMAANVTTYVIFITFSSIIAAPFLFALSGALIQVMQSIAASLAATGASGATSTIGISFGGTGIEPSDFRIFAIVSLCISATMSAMVISMIKKGSVKEGANNIPVFLVVSLTLYFIGNFIAGYLVGLFF